MKQNSFLKSVCNLAIPVAIQSMLQSSFSIVDQIMIGQLGSVSVAGVGLAGKFSSIYTVLISAVGAVAGIMIAQYLGQKNRQEIHRSFWVNVWIGVIFAAVFTVICGLFPEKIMGMYTKDVDTMMAAGAYLNIFAYSRSYFIGNVVSMYGKNTVAFDCQYCSSYSKYGIKLHIDIW